MSDSQSDKLEGLLTQAAGCYARQEYLQAIDGFRQAYALAQSINNLQQSSVSMANLGVAYVQVGDYASASESLQRAQSLMQQIGDRRGECRALINLGNVYEHVNQPGLSLNAWQSALDLARQMYDRELAAIAMDGLAGAYKKQGHLDEAKTLYLKLLEFNEKIANEEQQTDLLLDLARIELELGDTNQAESRVQKALYLARKNKDAANEAYCLYRLGTIYEYTGFRSEARDFLIRAAAYFRAQDDRERLGMTLNNLGMVYDGLGMYQDGLAAYQESLKIAESARNRVNQGGSLHGIGYIYHQIGNFKEALSYYERALRLTEEEGDWRLASQTLTNLGVLYADMDQVDKALATLKQAQQMQEAAGDLLSQGHTLISIAALYQRNNDNDQAYQVYEQALQIQRKTGDRDAQAATLNNMSELLAGSDRMADALDLKAQALDLFKKVSNPVGQIQTLYSLAKLHARTGDLQQSVLVLEQAISLIESMRFNLISEALRTSYFSHMHNIYALYVDVLLAMNRQADAFMMVERSKARAFLDLLSEARADFQEDIDPVLHQEEQSLLSEIEKLRRQKDALTKRVQDAQANDQIDLLESQVQELERRYQINQGKIRSQNPRYAALTQPSIWGISQVQHELLDGHTALLEYILGEQVSTLFVILKNDFEVFQLPSRSAIETKVRELRASLSLHRYAHGDALYHDLILPAAHLIRDKDLLIVADGALHYLPFSLLLTAPPDEGSTGDSPLPATLRSDQMMNEDAQLTERLEAELGPLPPFDFAELPYLLRQHSIRYAPSATVAGLMRRELENHPAVKQNEWQIAAVADPLLQGTAQLPAGAVRSLRGGLAALPYTADEVWALAGLFEPALPDIRSDEVNTRKVLLYTGVNATKPKILDLTNGRHTYRYLHIATHGLLNIESPQFSGLVFTSEAGEDAYWQTFEIFRAKIPAETVVLSACETGLGKVVRGEGLIGLTRAFLYAGAARVCVSLWKVADISTPDLMKYFYESMLTGKEAASALREAQLRLVGEGIFSHPFYWAAFVVVGSP